MTTSDGRALEARPPIRLLLSIPEAATALGISRSKTYELVASRQLEVVRIGRSCRVPLTALDAYVSNLRRSRIIPAPTAVTSVPSDMTAPEEDPNAGVIA